MMHPLEQHIMELNAVYLRILCGWCHTEATVNGNGLCPDCEKKAKGERKGGEDGKN